MIKVKLASDGWWRVGICISGSGGRAPYGQRWPKQNRSDVEEKWAASKFWSCQRGREGAVPFWCVSRVVGLLAIFLQSSQFNISRKLQSALKGNKPGRRFWVVFGDEWDDKIWIDGGAWGCQNAEGKYWKHTFLFNFALLWDPADRQGWRFDCWMESKCKKTFSIQFLHDVATLSHGTCVAACTFLLSSHLYVHVKIWEIFWRPASSAFRVCKAGSKSRD